MDELDKWTEHAKEVLDFWPIAYYPFQMIKTESGAGLEDLCPEEEIKKDWEIVRGKVKEENANGYPMFMGYEWQGCEMCIRDRPYHDALWLERQF